MFVSILVWPLIAILKMYSKKSVEFRSECFFWILFLNWDDKKKRQQFKFTHLCEVSHLSPHVSWIFFSNQQNILLEFHNVFITSIIFDNIIVNDFSTLSNVLGFNTLFLPSFLLSTQCSIPLKLILDNSTVYIVHNIIINRV